MCRAAIDLWTEATQPPAAQRQPQEHQQPQHRQLQHQQPPHQQAPARPQERHEQRLYGGHALHQPAPPSNGAYAGAAQVAAAPAPRHFGVAGATTGGSFPGLAPRREQSNLGLSASAPRVSQAPPCEKESNAVVGFLDSIGLPMYSAALLRNGIDDLGKLSRVEDADLRGVGIPATQGLHLRRKLFESRFRGYEEPPQAAAESNTVVAFLYDAGLGQYANAFLAGGFEDMETLVLIDEQDLKDMGVQRGHIVKLRRKLREYQAQCSEPPAPFPIPAPTGHWPMATPATMVMPPQQSAYGLEREGISALELSWQQIEAIGTCAVGEVLFRHVFALAPEASAMFPPDVRARYQEWTAHEADESLEHDVTKSAALRRIFAKIVNAVGCTVAGLHDMHKLVPMVVKLGVRHYHYGVRECHLRVLSTALDLTLQDVLGAEYTAEVRHAWSIVFNLISSLMTESFRQVAEKHGDHEVSFLRFQCGGCAASGRPHSKARSAAAASKLEVAMEEEQDWPLRGKFTRGRTEEPEAEFPAPESPESQPSGVAIVA